MDSASKFTKDGEYYEAWGKAYRLHATYAAAKTDEDFTRLAEDIRAFDSAFERALMMAVVQEIERAYVSREEVVG